MKHNLSEKNEMKIILTKLAKWFTLLNEQVNNQ